MDTNNAHRFWLLNHHTSLACALAVVLHAPIGTMAQATGLADHQIGSNQTGFQLGDVIGGFFQSGWVRQPMCLHNVGGR